MKHRLIFFLHYFYTYRLWEKYKISPESLPVAHINQEYQQIIKISGGKVIDKYAELETNIPENLGITVKPVDDLDGYNVIQIKGVPKYKGKYTIHIRADFYAGGDAEIDKTYSFIVQD